MNPFGNLLLISSFNAIPAQNHYHLAKKKKKNTSMHIVAVVEYDTFL